MKVDWLLWSVLSVFVIVLGIEMYQYNDLQRALVLQVEINKAVLQNKDLITNLAQQIALGPRNTACDAKKMLEELRAKGIQMSPSEVEKRCKE